MPNVRNIREARLNLRIAKSLEERIARLAGAAGQADSVVAALALAIGIRTLENSLLPPEAEVLAAMGGVMKGQIERDVEQQAEVLAPQPMPVGAAFGRRDPRASLDERSSFALLEDMLSGR